MNSREDVISEDDSVTLHGVFIEVLGLGVLLEGRAGIGKSALALELISRGHKLIADDAPLFRCCSCTTIMGNCPPLLQDFVEVYGLGVLNIPAMFGPDAVKKTSRLQLVISLLDPEQYEREKREPLRGAHGQKSILGVKVPLLYLPFLRGNNMAVMIESAIRNHKLRLTGYDAAETLEEKQRSLTKTKR